MLADHNELPIHARADRARREAEISKRFSLPQLAPCLNAALQEGATGDHGTGTNLRCFLLLAHAR